ncbi:MAG TPA: hypothetical protein VF622_11785 [Segetibacter sp.]
MRTKKPIKKTVEPGEKFCHGCQTMHDNEMFYPNRRNCKKYDNEQSKKKYREKVDAFAAFF